MPISILIFTLFLAGPLAGNVDLLFREANDSVERAEKSTSYEERKEALNRALYLFSLIGEQSPTPALNRMIGDLYYQLGEFPWAVLHYQRTLSKTPDDPLATEHLEKAQQKLGLPPSSLLEKENGIAKGWRLLAHPGLLFWAILATFLTCSLSLWLPYRFIRRCATFFTILTLLLIANGIAQYYLKPVEGIVIHSTSIYSAPAQNQRIFPSVRLIAGSKVKVLQLSAEGDWVEIASTPNLVGFIPIANLRLI